MLMMKNFFKPLLVFTCIVSSFLSKDTKRKKRNACLLFENSLSFCIFTIKKMIKKKQYF